MTAKPGLTIAQVVKARREALRLSQRELGRRARLSITYVHALENEKLVPTLSSFARLVVELRLSPMEVFVLVINEAERSKDDE